MVIIGTSFDSSFWLNNEPCGFVCGMMTWVLVLYGVYVTNVKIIAPWLGLMSFKGVLHTVIFDALSLLALYSHWMTMTTDPGAVPRDARPLLTDDQEYDIELARDRSTPYKKYCRRCKGFKPRRAHHCSICERCIIKMDHHCPWVNNCVGIGNTKLFLQFLVSIFIVSVYAITLIIFKVLSCSTSRRSQYYCPSTPGDTVFVMGLLVEGILFGLFTICMIADQSESIFSNQTQIDRLKNERHDIQDEVNEVFGTPSGKSCHSSWFLPSKVIFPHKYRDKIYGYTMFQESSQNDVEDSTEITPLTAQSNSSKDGFESDDTIVGKDSVEKHDRQIQAFMRKRVNAPES